MSKTNLEQKAIIQYQTADDAGKKLLENLFGTEIFITKITDRIKTFNDVEEITGTALVRRDDESNDEFAYRQVKLIAKAYNGDQVIEPNNADQYKYYPWFEVKPNAEFGLVYDGTGSWNAHTYVGSRLCFVNREHAINAGQKFIEIYSKLLIK